ncbi:hypothetical protein [Alysiella filiformis]|uniref:Uncharacterized protein n=1 Tax=Alysiella filiformis DSM 16848 TaxID=1120981 RepID=A0A286E5E7_9NEIS|nr:hypothetical protein [Alysiella filiformis]QMT30388.1 hypothetical protein H3L97_06370 [Alysiella filiformis]SOD66125.1 hypothetical protein SAMN02746062_00506 [Alysiella filiformis DSM 16848]
MLDFPFLIICLFVFIFFVQTLRQHQFNWLWFAVAIWLVLGLFSGSVLPRVLGITQPFNLYLAHFYVFMGSIFFFLNSTFRLPERKATWHTPQVGAYLNLLAITGLCMHLAFGMLVALTWWTYPQGYAAMLPAKLFAMYALDPIFWYGTQFLLMLLFVLHRKMLGESARIFSLPQIQVGVLLCLLWQFLYVINAYVWLPRLLRWLLLNF